MKMNMKERRSAQMSRKAKIDLSLQEVSDALGVEIDREYMPRDHDFELAIRLSQIPSPHGFNMKIYDNYLSWKVELQLDVFTTPLISSMQSRYVDRKKGLESYLELAKAKNNYFSLLVNGNLDIATVNDEWKDINFSLAKSYYSEDSEFSSLSAVLLDFMCVLLFLIVEDTEWKISDEIGKEEGGSYNQIVQKYERSRFNRALCLKYFGFSCRGCGDKLTEKYGPIGTGVIHVHHIVPISQMGSSYSLNPIKDLIPLCPNCHNIVHQTNPPISISELNLITKFIPN
jgi:5-methylcytosine-specific restriction enzyme A